MAWKMAWKTSLVNLSWILLASGALWPPTSLAKTPTPSPCSQSPQDYLQSYQTKPSPLAMVCFQYALQRDPQSYPDVPASTLPPPGDQVIDIFGQRLKNNKLIYREHWQPLPGFPHLYYDPASVSPYYPQGVPMIQIMGTSTLGSNPYKVAMTVNCRQRTITYEAVARRYTRIYDYSSRYHMAGDFAPEAVDQLCRALLSPP